MQHDETAATRAAEAVEDEDGSPSEGMPVPKAEDLDRPDADEPAPAAATSTATEKVGRRRRRSRGGRRRRGRERTEAHDELTPPEHDEAAEPADAVEEPVEDEALLTEGGITVQNVTDEHLRPIRDGREMLINVADSEECRIATLQNGRLDELYMERVSSASHVGNIYKGRVTNVEPSIQAAFVDFGLPAQGFLHISDLHPRYFPGGREEQEQVGRKTPRRERPPIQRCLRRGQEVIVQITKEGIGTKGPTLTTYISVPGRFLVMMPGMHQHGVSRKVEDEEIRRQLRDVLAQLDLPKEMGFILRTAAIGRTKRDLQRDLAYLMRLWKSTEERIRSERAPCVLYEESDLVIRTIRDVFDSDVKRIVCDDAATARRIADFLSIASPRSRDTVFHYDRRDPIFHACNVEAEIEKLHSKHVPLPCGGSLVIESTEALVAIDVNSGRFRVPDDPEQTAYRVNLEAADEIARQLRLRDLGGLIICDFIDMRAEKHKRAVERRLRDALKHHKERAKCLRFSQFGIIEMTRQRQRPSLSKSIYQECPRCRGVGMVKTPESVSLDVMRAIRSACQRDGIAIVDVQVNPAVANHLLNRKRRVLTELEAQSGRTLLVRGEQAFAIDEVRYSCTDRRGRDLPFADVYAQTAPGGRTPPAADERSAAEAGGGPNGGSGRRGQQRG